MGCPPLDNTELRIKFLLNEMDEVELTRKLKTAEKKFQKKQEHFNVFDAFVTAGHDLFRRIVNNPSDAQLLGHVFIDEMKQIISFANENLTAISRVYKSKLQHILIPSKEGEPFSVGCPKY